MNLKRIPIDLLIFDFDGTLNDSIPSAIKAVQRMLSELDFPAKSVKEIHDHVGYGETPLISGAIGSQDPELVKKAMETYQKCYVEGEIKNIPLYPNVKETLELFKNKTMIIVSNKKDAFIKIILANLNLTHYFTEIFGGDTSPALKPDPGAINYVLNKYKVSPDRALFIGDMTIDIETGKNAGIKTCAVTYGFDPKEKLAKAKPDFLIDDLIKLKEIIE